MALGKLAVLIWIRVGQEPTALAVGTDGVWTFFSHLSFLFSFSLSLGETARYTLRYCHKGPLSPKQPAKNQPTTNHLPLTQGAFVSYWRNDRHLGLISRRS